MNQLRSSLSPRQQEILEFIREFIRENQYPPSVRDIVKGIKMSSTSVAAYHIKQLEARGFLRRQPDISRGLELVAGGGDEGVKVPLMGLIAAGRPVPVPSPDTWDQARTADTVTVPGGIISGSGHNMYALKVKGDSMQDALIDDGDTIIIQAVNRVENGETAVVWLKDEKETTLKKVYSEKNLIKLQPANSRYSAIYTGAGNVEIQGRLVAVLRSL